MILFLFLKYFQQSVSLYRAVSAMNEQENWPSAVGHANSKVGHYQHTVPHRPA